jgi:hypothetical protein
MMTMMVILGIITYYRLATEKHLRYIVKTIHKRNIIISQFRLTNQVGRSEATVQGFKLRGVFR